MSAETTHAALVKKAVAFLRYKVPCVLFVPECGVTSECPDAVGWTAHGECVVVECKASRADFLADRKKPHRADGAGVGHTRYFLAPDGLVKSAEVPAGWGLLVLRGRSVFIAHQPERRAMHDERTNATLLLHLARRACDYEPASLVAKIERERERGRAAAAQHREWEERRARENTEIMARHAERAAVVTLFDIEAEAAMRVCECGATPDLSGAWRWTEDGYEHHHGYPIGHLAARRTETV